MTCPYSKIIMPVVMTKQHVLVTLGIKAAPNAAPMITHIGFKLI